MQNNTTHEYKVKGIVVREGENWYIKNEDKYYLASDLLTGIDLISIDCDNYTTREGDEIEIYIGVKSK